MVRVKVLTVRLAVVMLSFRACPECRVKSDFVTPSRYWVEDDHEKQLLIGAYKESLWYIFTC